MTISRELRAFLEENDALENFKKEAKPSLTTHASISGSINWEHSEKGAKYWADLAFKYRRHETRKRT